MGAWGTGSFDNDDALDWLADLERNGPAFLEQTLDVKSGSLGLAFLGYIDAPEASAALAAAEMVAAAQGRPPANWPPQAAQWLAAHRAALNPERLRGKALDAIAAVRKKSELRDLWVESEKFLPQWLAGLKDLERRLKGP